MTSKHYLPSKVHSYLRRLDIEYARAGSGLLREIITSARIAVKEGVSWERWDNYYEHDVMLYLPPDTMKKLDFGHQRELCDQIARGLNDCASAIDNESFRAVVVELVDDSDPLCQSAIPITDRPQTDPDTLSIWRPGHVRLFISHRDDKKIQAKKLAEALEPYGVSAFVAHDTIEPMSTWQREIEKGLETMEIMLAFVTDDFHNSTWTNQEIGYALGKNIPIIALKLESRDPAGFIATQQALKGRLEQPEASVKGIYTILAEKLGHKARLKQPLISAFVASPNYNEARDRFDRMSNMVETLSDDEFRQIQAGFFRNNQLYDSIYLRANKRLHSFLERCTGKSLEIAGNKIAIHNIVADNDTPF